MILEPNEACSVAGHFGCVYAATLRDSTLRNPVPVAVKTIEGKHHLSVSRSNL